MRLMAMSLARAALPVIVLAVVGPVAWHAAAQTGKPPVEVPKDRVIAGEFSPARVSADQEAAARKQSHSGKGALPRGQRFYFVWTSLSPSEFEALDRHTIVLVSTWARNAAELPVRRIYVRGDGREIPVYRVATWRTPVEPGSFTADVYGTNREDGFYLVPGAALLRKGELVMDLTSGRNGWVMVALPSTVASAEPRRFTDLEPTGRKPDLRTIQQLVQRRFTGFPVPQRLPD